MKVGQILITHFIQIHCLFAISLHYDATNHYYDDLLISISPDVEGEKNHKNIHSYTLCTSCKNIIGTQSDDTIENIKQWITEVSNGKIYII